MKVDVEIDEEEIEGDYRTIDGLRLTCLRCSHTTEVFGRSVESAHRGALQLRDECPNGENNFYMVDHYT